MTMKELLVTLAVALVVCTCASPTSHHLRHKHGHHKYNTDEEQPKSSEHKFIDTPTNNLPKEFDGVEGTLVLESDSQEEVEKTVKILREKDLEEKENGAEEVFIPIPLPTDFNSYDVRPKDGYISLDELSNVTGAHENAELAFNASDKNGDGKLTKEEFDKAPWSLQGDEHLDTGVGVDTLPQQMNRRKQSLDQEQDLGPIDKVAITDDDPQLPGEETET